MTDQPVSDIVERLRAVMRDQFYEMPKVSRTCEDAANVIERLRSEDLIALADRIGEISGRCSYERDREAIIEAATTLRSLAQPTRK